MFAASEVDCVDDKSSAPRPKQKVALKNNYVRAVQTPDRILKAQYLCIQNTSSARGLGDRIQNIICAKLSAHHCASCLSKWKIIEP